MEDISAEIIVVDNASADDSCAMVKTSFPNVILLENKENLGFSKGNNQGVKKANGNFICILNPDTVVAEDTFINLLNFAEKQSKLGSIGCKLIDGQGRFLPESKRHVPTPIVSAKKMLGQTDSYYVPELNNNGTGKVEILVGAFMLLKKKVYDEVSGFDEDYFMYGEDIDLSYRILKKGYQNFYNGTTSVIHFKGESTLKDKEYSKRFYGAMQIFYKKHFKSNLFFNVMVWLWVNLAKRKHQSSPISRIKTKHTILISKSGYPALEAKFDNQLITHPTFTAYQNQTEFILDNNHLSFKHIIDILQGAPENCSATFKILPKNSNFILGSDSSKHQGLVIKF